MSLMEPLLAAEAVSLHYKGLTRAALDDVSVQVQPGRTLGVVGESGSGKSSLARVLLGLERLSGGCVRYRGRDIEHFGRRERMEFRRKVQMVFQDPFNSLNPRKTIGATLAEVLRVHGINGATSASLLEKVGLDAAMAERYPHELSGGQRQRVGIARAMSLQPEIIIADEPVSALDVSVQAHILNLLKRLVQETGVTLVLIAHDLAVVRQVCDEVIVMCEGRVVEQGAAGQVLSRPEHTYTQQLMAAVPMLP
jgi:ABC-type glutathione transport system ATPase component